MDNASLDATAAAELFLAGALNAGLGHVCISPGSRSTPLAVAALRTPELTTSIHLDERVAGFNALGRARQSRTAVGLICTSGTAAANFVPAVAEAGMNNVPLVVLTADRPPEHLSWGVGQTFQQQGLYHRQVRAEFAMPVGGDGGAGFSQRAGWRAVTTALEKHGPVHVNWPFRLPLEPKSSSITPPAPLARGHLRESRAEASEVADLAATLTASARPLIIAGPNAINLGPGSTDLDTEIAAQEFDSAARTLGIPIIADSLSGLRGPDRKALVASPSLVVKLSESTLDTLAPDLIIHIGQTPTAKAIRLWWERQDCVHVLIDPLNEWNDPSHLGTQRFASSPETLFAEVPRDDPSNRDAHLDRWLTAGRTAQGCRDDALDTTTQLTEPAIAACLAAFSTQDDHLVTSSSMPVRDIDTFASVSCAAPITSNRGINGIDGVVSTASGISQARAATNTEGATFVLIGDVALLHDLGGVVDAARNGVPLIIICPNNDGGGIFSMLPAKAALDGTTFDTLFQTPHGATFEFLGHYPGVHHEHVSESDVANLHTALHAAKTNPRAPVTILEVATSTAQRLAFQSSLDSELHEL